MNGYIASNGSLVGGTNGAIHQHHHAPPPALRHPAHPLPHPHGQIIQNGGPPLLVTTAMPSTSMAGAMVNTGQLTYYNPRLANGQSARPQVSVVIGPTIHSGRQTQVPSKCCWLCCCCLAPLWYNNCNIYRVRLRSAHTINRIDGHCLGLTM